MKTVLNIKTDKEIKERAKNLAAHLGIPLSTVVNAYLKEFVNSGSFSVAREPSLKPTVRAVIEKQVEDAKAGKNISPTFSSHQEAMDWLKA